MKDKNSKPVTYYFRMLHRYVGFFLIGITVVFSISGIVLIYRDTNFLKTKTHIEKQLPANLKASELGEALRMRNFKVTQQTDDTLYFANGTYAIKTGVVAYDEMQLPSWINKMNGLHKSQSKSTLHWVTLAYGVLLFFMAISSFWMFKTSTKQFKRGIAIAIVGVAAATLVLLL